MTALTFFVILIVWGVCLQYLLEKGRGLADHLREKDFPEPLVILISVAMARYWLGFMCSVTIWLRLCSNDIP